MRRCRNNVRLKHKICLVWPQMAVRTSLHLNSNTRVRTDVRLTKIHTLGESDSKASSGPHVQNVLEIV